jgi:hypothetical protein
MNVGKKLFLGESTNDLPSKINRTLFPCEYCGQAFPLGTGPQGTILEANEAEIKNSSIEPEPS